MVKYCRRRGGGVQPPKNPKITFFRYNFQIPGGGVRTPRSPTGSAHDLDPFYGKVNFGNRGFYMGKSENYVFLKKNDCSLRPEKW